MDGSVALQPSPSQMGTDLSPGASNGDVNGVDGGKAGEPPTLSMILTIRLLMQGKVTKYNILVGYKHVVSGLLT